MFDYVVTALNWLSLLLLLSLVASKVSPTARFYFRSFLMYLFILINACASIPYGLAHFGQYRNNTLFSARISQFWDQFLGVTWRVEEEAAPDTNKGYVIVCNHQSSLDTYGMMRVRPLFIYKTWSTLYFPILLRRSGTSSERSTRLLRKNSCMLVRSVSTCT